MPATFRALRHRNYRLWFFGQGLSLVGTWMQTVAQQVLVYRLTASAAALGTVSFIGIIPLLPLALWGGSLADRLPKRRVLLVTQTLMLVQALVLGLLAWTGAVQVWHVYVLAFLLASVQAVDIPVRQSFTVEMVEGKEDLTNAIALNSTIFNLARALGPALAGTVVAAVGEGPAFLVNALSFVAVLGSLLLMRGLPPPRPTARTHSLPGHLGEGIRFVAGQQTLRVLISLVAVSAFLSMPYNTLMPAFANRVLAESARPVVAFLCEGQRPLMRCQTPEALPLGLLLTTVGVGAVIGALLVASLPNRAPRGRMLTIGNLGFPAALLLFTLTPSFLAALPLLLLVGVSFVWQNSLANTLIQLNAPDEMRGRVMSVYSLTMQGAMRLGALQAGLLADRIGVALAVGLGAALSLAYGMLVAMRYPKVRGMA